MDIPLIGIPFNGDGTSPESENPGQALRDAGLGAALAARGHRLRELGDLSVPRCDGRREPGSGVLNRRAWRELTATSSAALRWWLEPSGFLLVLGGDCAIMSGICLAMRRMGLPMGIVYVDGHADARLPQDSPTGEPADLVLTALTGRIPGLFDDLTDDGRPLAADDEIVVLGHRDADRVREFDIPAHTRADLQRLGARRAVSEALHPMVNRGALAWLHFDVDVLDPSVMPAVLFPEWEGLDVDEAAAVLSEVIATVPVLGMSVACYHPRLDPGGAAAHRIVQLLADAIPRRPAGGP